MSHHVSFPERDPFTVILPNCKTAIPPPAWYGMPVPPASDNEDIARPRNAFIIFLTHEHAERKARNAPKRVARDLSKEIGIKWGNMSTEQKQPYERAAAWEEAVHKLRWPGYKFNPSSKGSSKGSLKGSSKGRKAKTQAEPAEGRAEDEESQVERQVEEAEVRAEKAQRQARKALMEAEQAQRRLEDARRMADEIRQRGSSCEVSRQRSDAAVMRWGSREPAFTSRQQRASSGHSQARSSRRTEKTSRREDGHRVESAPSGNSKGQAFSDPSPLIRQQAAIFGYLQGSGSYLQPEEAQRTRAGRTVVQKLDPALLSQHPPPSYGHSQRAGSSNGMAQNFPELFLPFQQQACDFGSSQGSDIYYPTAEVQKMQSSGVAGQGCVDPALLFLHPPPSYGHSQGSSSYPPIA